MVFSQVTLTIEQANHLASLPLKCINKEYPNKLNQVLDNEHDLGSPKELHPAFYGCFDWHSSVHGHWVLVKLLNDFPEIANKDSMLLKLQNSLSKENIQKEIDYFNKKQENSFERTYGWAWLLKLQQELSQSPKPELQELAKNLTPFSKLLVEKYIAFLPKLNYPIRVGTHNNTGFGMSFAYDYAKFSNDENLTLSIEKNAIRLFKKDKQCPLNWEPNGTDFLSPCLEELNIMRRILPKNEFLVWSRAFLPQLENKNFSWEVGKVSDPTDGHLVHLNGLNFSRAWVLYGLSKQFPSKYKHLTLLADKHLRYSLPSVVDGNYEGEHWLASFALYALSEK